MFVAVLATFWGAVWIVLGVLGSVASFIGLYALVDNRRSKRIKRLLFECTGFLPLATATPVERDYRLSIRYQPPNQPEEEIDAAFVSYLRFANFGKEPIRREDIAPANPIRISATGGRVLDVSLTASRRDVCRVDVAAPEIGNDTADATVTFDFLDYHDGGVVRVLATDWKVKVKMIGDIIGMPEGINAARSLRRFSGRAGFALFVLGEFVAFGSAALWVHYSPGFDASSWPDSLVFVLVPFVCFAFPVMAAFAVDELLPWGSDQRRWPDGLALPKWLRGVLMSHRDRDEPPPVWMPPYGFEDNDDAESPDNPEGAPAISSPDRSS